MPRRRSVSGQAVKLLAHVGLGRNHDRFLMQPVGIEPFRLGEQRGDLIGEPRANGVRPAPRRTLGALGQRGYFVKPERQHAAQRGAFAAAHLGECCNSVGKPRNNRAFGDAPLILILLGIGDFDHAFKGQ